MPNDPILASGQSEIRIATGSGSITIVGEVRDDVVPDGRARLEHGADGSVEVVLAKRSQTVTVRCPEGTDVVAGTKSGSLHFKGRLGAVRATTQSGSIQVDEAKSADVRAQSGSIAVGVCAGACRMKTKSGSARVGSAGAAEVMIGSGSVRIDHVEGSARVRATSGSVAIDAEGGGPIEVETMSGSITITLPDDCRPEVRAKSLSGRPRVDSRPGHDCVVVARTLSGGITVRPR
jgi:putative adhesin